MTKLTLTLLFSAFGATAVALHAPSVAAATPSSDFCKKWSRDIRSKPAKRAMALSADGKICHSVWGEITQAAADRKALAGCQENGERKCSIVRR